MKKHITSLLFALLVLGLKAQTPVLTLDSCFALAKANNAQLLTDQLEIQKAQEVKAQVFTKHFPQVSISYLAYYAARPIIEYGINDIQDDDLGAFLSALITTLNDPEGANMGLPTEINLMEKGHGVNATAMMPVYAGGRILNGNRLANVGIEAAQLKADNLILLVDLNGLQSDGETENILSWRNLDAVLLAIGWEVHSIDGHDFMAIENAIQSNAVRPKAIMCKTVKGKGISFMENDPSWHDRYLRADELERAKKEVGLQ